MKLVTLHADQRDQVFHVATIRFPQQLKIAEVRLDVLIDGMHLNGYTRHLTGHETGNVVNGAIGHEAFPESLDQTSWVVFGRLDNHDAKLGWIGHNFPFSKTNFVHLEFAMMYCISTGEFPQSDQRKSGTIFLLAPTRKLPIGGCGNSRPHYPSPQRGCDRFADLLG